MSLKDRLNLVLGAEDGSPDVVLVTPEEHAIVLADSEISASNVVVAEAQQEIVQNTVDIEQLEERVEDLESDVAGLEAMMSGETPWNPDLAREKYERARKIGIRTFGEDDAVSIKGAEAFGDASTAEMELLTGVEALKEKASNMWAGIKQFFINLYNSVIAFFTGIFNTLRGLEKKADAIIAKANGIADEKIKNSIKLGKWNLYLDIEKNPVGKTTVNDFIKTLPHISKGLENQTVDAFVSAFSSAGSTLDAALDSKKEAISTDNTTSHKAKFRGIEFSLTLPKSNAEDKTAALRATSISYKVAKEGSGVKTEGEFTSGLKKIGLISEARTVKKEAQDARVAKFDQAALKNDRDKAIAKIANAEKDKKQIKDEINGVRAGNQAALKLASTITSFESKIIAAKLAYLSAHF